MSRLVRKHAPVFVTAALMAWCCWSQFRGSAPLLADMEEVQPAQIERSALRPEISPPSQRDPFLQSKPEPEQVAVIAPVEPVTEAPPEPLFDPQTVLSDFRLDATMVGTDYPVALINGQVYSEGEQIVLKGLPELHCELRRVLADRVILEIEKEEFEIIYSQTSTTQQQITEPLQGPTTQRQLDSAADPVGKESSPANLLQLLRSVLPNFDAELDSLRDQCPLPPPAKNEIDNPNTDASDQAQL